MWGSASSASARPSAARCRASTWPRPHHGQDGRPQDSRSRKRTRPSRPASKASTSRREGEIALQLKHPRIVETLRNRPDQGRQAIRRHGVRQRHGHARPDQEPRTVSSTATGINLFRQMAEAIDAVHKAGYIHRDICPRNFIVTADADVAQADRLRPDAADPAGVHAARQPHGDAAVTWPRRSSAASRPTSGSISSRWASAPIRLWSFDFPVALDRHDRHRRPAARQPCPEADQGSLPADRAHGGQGDHAVSGTRPQRRPQTAGDVVKSLGKVTSDDAA